MTRPAIAAGACLALALGGALALLGPAYRAGPPAATGAPRTAPETASRAGGGSGPAPAGAVHPAAPSPSGTTATSDPAAASALRSGIAAELLAAVEAGDAALALAAEEALAARGAAAIPALAAILAPGSGASEEARARAAFILGKIGGPEAALVLAGALESEPSALVRGQIVLGLGMTGAREALEPLREALARDGEDGEVRASAAHALAKLSAEGTALACADARAAADPRVLSWTLEALGGAADVTAARAAVIELTARADEAGRRAAARSLARLGPDAAAAGALALSARSDPAPIVRIEALEALEGAAGRAVAEAVRIEALRADAWPPVRARAAEALGRAGTPAALAALVAALAGDADIVVRTYAVEGLALSDDPAGLAALERAAASDSARQVRAAAADGRDRIVGRRR